MQPHNEWGYNRPLISAVDIKGSTHKVAAARLRMQSCDIDLFNQGGEAGKLDEGLLLVDAIYEAELIHEHLSKREGLNNIPEVRVTCLIIECWAEMAINDSGVGVPRFIENADLDPDKKALFQGTIWSSTNTPSENLILVEKAKSKFTTGASKPMDIKETLYKTMEEAMDVKSNPKRTRSTSH